MKDIAIIVPNNPFLINDRVFPNMGAVRVATQLERDGYNVDLHDFAGRNPAEIRLIARDYEFFGFSATTPQMPYVMNLRRILLRENKRAKTILGGAHASALYELRRKGIKDVNIKDAEVFRTVFAGEGEDTSNIFKPGWQKGKLVHNIDDLPIPDRTFIDMSSYNYSLFGKPTTTIQTQRGCPHQCAFCSGRDVEMYNRVRMHSPQRVLEEMDKVNREYGFESFMWYDDEINLNNARLEELCAALSERPYQHRGFVRSDMIVKHPESVEWMKKAGFVKLCTGVESGSDRILERIKKRTTSAVNSEARRIIKAAGIHYESFMLLGHPGETFEDVNKSYEWLKNNKPDDFDINLITPYPGSVMYDEAERSDKFKNYRFHYKGMYFNKPRYAVEDSFYKGLNAQSHSDVRTTQISNQMLKTLRDDIDRSLK